MSDDSVPAPAGPILVATDFSVPARHAAERAARLAHETVSPLVLLHVEPGDLLAWLDEWLGQDSDARHRLRHDHHQRLDTLADELHRSRRVEVSVQRRDGAVPAAIREAADTLDARLVVLGARGARPLRRLLLGSTAERMLHLSRRPLLVVRQRAHEPYRRVLVAVDFSGWSLPSLAAARLVAPHAQLTLLTVFQTPFEEKMHFAGVEPATIARYRQQARQQATRQLHPLAARAGLRAGHWTAQVVEGDAWMRVVEQAQQDDCDLVVMGRQGRSAGAELLLGSVTRQVLAEIDTDLLLSTRHEELSQP